MSGNKADLERKVQGIIEQIRPYLQNDGGDIRFVEITDDNTVNVEFFSPQTLTAFYKKNTFSIPFQNNYQENAARLAQLLLK